MFLDEYMNEFKTLEYIPTKVKYILISKRIQLWIPLKSLGHLVFEKSTAVNMSALHYFRSSKRHSLLQVDLVRETVLSKPSSINTFFTELKYNVVKNAIALRLYPQLC